MNLKETIRRVLREELHSTSGDEVDLSKHMESLLKTTFVPSHEKDVCDVKVAKSFNKKSNKLGYVVTVYLIGGPNTRNFPVTQAVNTKMDSILDEAWNYVYDYFNVGVAVSRKFVSSCDEVSKEEETEGVGAYSAPAFEMEPDHVHFKHQYSIKESIPASIKRRFEEIADFVRGSYRWLNPKAFDSLEDFVDRVIFSATIDFVAEFAPSDIDYDEMLKVRDEITPYVKKIVNDEFIDEIREYYENDRK